MGGRYTYKAVGRETGGRYGLVEFTAPAGSPGPPPHIHETEEEALYVIEGQLSIQIAERTLEARAGAFVLVPRGTVHTFSNPAPPAGQGAGDRVPGRLREGVRRDG
jgi:quercetin dioxygenase-like cupin family protein